MGYDTTEQKGPKFSKEEYWAAEAVDTVGTQIKEKVDGYYLFVRGFGRLQMWHRSYNQYYMNCQKGARLYQTGVDGEYTVLNVNHYHNILAHIKALVTSSRPAFEARASNTDYESMAQCLVAEGLLDYYMKTKGMENNIATAVEHALIFGEGYIRVLWDAQSGKLYGTDNNGEAVHEGDLQFTNFGPLDVIRDYSKVTAHDHDWAIIRTFKNKFTLAAKFPDSKDMILSSPTRQNVQKDLIFTMPMLFKDTDDIIVYEFYHRPTAALPKGRMTWINDNGDVIMDGGLPYDNIPVYRMAAEEQAESAFGFTVGFDLLPIQENLDNMFSTIATNQNAFGVQNIIIEQGSGFAAPDMYGSVKLLTIPQGAMEPKALQLCSTPPEIFQFVKTMIGDMETLSGVNSVARGQPEPSLKSGAALALVQSMAIQFNMPMQLSYTRLIEHLGVATIKILKSNAAVPRIAAITGKAKRSYLKEFTMKDLEHVDRVVVDLGNPLTQTTAGRVNLAETLLQNKLVTNADEYIQVLMTGSFEPIIEGKEAELMLIRAENEGLQDGKSQNVIITDNHAEHINEHKVVLSSPEARMNPTLVQNTLKHLQDHIDMLKNPQYQDLLNLLGEHPIAPQQPAGPPGGMPAGTAGTPVQPPAAIHPIAAEPSGPPLQQQTPGHVNQIALPSGPRNPLTQVKTMLPNGAGRNTALSGKAPPHP